MHFVDLRQVSLAADGQVQLAQAVAALVESDAVRKSAVDRSDFQHVDKEFAQLEGLVLDIVQGRLVADEAVVVMPHHRHATARRADDVVELAKYGDEPLGDGARVVVAAGIGHRLAAAGLLGGILDGRAGAKCSSSASVATPTCG